MAYFPLFVDLKNKNILIVGGGKVAYRKLLKLLPFEAKFTLIAPKICDEIKNLAKSNTNIILKNRKFETDDIKNSFLVISATNNKKINQNIAQISQNMNIPINSVDDIENCSFIFPAVIKKGAFVMGCSTSGKSPDIAAYLKNIFEQTLPENLEQIIENISILRQNLKLIIPEQNIRSKIIHSLLEYYKNNNFKLDYNELEKEMNNLIESNNINNRIGV